APPLCRRQIRRRDAGPKRRDRNSLISSHKLTAGYTSCVVGLDKYKSGKIPTFDLSVWLFRERQWADDTKPEDIVTTFLSDFHISDKEKEHLFDVDIPNHVDVNTLFSTHKVTWPELEEIIDLPPDMKEEGGILSSLELLGVGPAKQLKVAFSERVNLITGDNGLGKTFILEAAWWALSGSWTGSPVYPREDAKKGEPTITFQISGASARSETGTAGYDWKRQCWLSTKKRQTLPGFLIYARVDGAFAVWDPARSSSSTLDIDNANLLVFSREDVWDGLMTKAGGRTKYLCNGLIIDWVNWQNNPSESPFATLTKVLKRLSPPGLDYGDLGSLSPGKPTRIPGESRLIPTIKHPYGEVPLIYASASVRRIVALAYLLVWAWEEHKAQSELIREPPQRKMGFLVDEVEAHLHPQWQRVIIPALLDVVDDLEQFLEVQFFITTHSPLVMASIEPKFDVDRDQIFHLNLVQRGAGLGEVVIESPEFIKRGSVDSWLRSEIFELKQPSSIEAEEALMHAIKLQERDSVTTDEVKQASDRLQKYLPSHDKFWPRWTFFAKKHGVEL
ncbi:MAG: AAA family ATPase, partial [Desulfomonilaceae bacterium]